MDLILNFGFAWISVLLGILLTAIFFLRKLIHKNEKYKAMFHSLNKILRKQHKALGITLVLTGLIHGYFSSDSLFSLNLGTICWVISILLGLNYMLRKRFAKIKGWMYYHRILTVGFVSVLILHIYNVGIQAPGLLVEALNGSQYEAYAETSTSGVTTTGSNTSTSDLLDSSNSESVVGNDTTVSSDSTVRSDSAVSSDSAISSGTAVNSDTSASSTSDTSNSSSTYISSLNEQLEGVVLTDGVYEGVATGYREGLTVSVTVEDNSITNIEIVSHNEQKSRYYAPAMEQVPAEILDSQSLSVDTVSGSTFTSIGIINAVKDALSQALVSGTLPEDLSLPTRKGHR